MTRAVHDVSVIICAYTEDRWDDLVAAVESVRQQTMKPREIIIVIDHNANLLERVQEQLGGIIAIENNRAKGASGARNSGATVATGAVLVFLDDDAIADLNWLEKLLDGYSDSTIVGVGGKIEPRWLVSRPFWFPDEFNWVVGCTYRGLPIQKNNVLRNVIGANMSVRKNVITTVGGFRESFGNNKGQSKGHIGFNLLHHYAGDEETEFCIRVTQYYPDSKWLYTTVATVHHCVPAQRTRWKFFLWRCYDEGLGKAQLVQMHGTQTSLSTERIYTFKVLPKGIMRGLTDSFLHFDPTGFARAGAIVIGLSAVALGYSVGSISSQFTKLSDTSTASIDSHSHSKVPSVKVHQ